MSGTSTLFRSHLMQQFATAARGQSRPPLALVGYSSSSSISSRSNTNHQKASGSRRHDRPRDTPPASSHPNTTTTTPIRHQQSPRNLGRRIHSGEQVPSSTSLNATKAPSVRQFSSSSLSLGVTTSAACPSSPKDNDSTETIGNGDDAVLESSMMLQALILSRRTISAFNHKSTRDMKGSLERAVLCGLNAPNHHRTKHFSFKRLLSPSSATDHLADIAFRVKLSKRPECENNRALAERKREKWSQIPAFLVALVEGQPEQKTRNYAIEETHDDDDDDGYNDGYEYEALPFIGPANARQLEDYAAASAAIQNILLSLHAEGIGTKWATGPVVRTPAFRSHIKARSDELVVGLVMIGYPTRIPKEPRRNKSTEELLEDL